MGLKRLVALLLVFVMVGSAIGPALAAGTEQKIRASSTKMPSHGKKIKYIKEKFIVVGITGIEKNNILARVLKNKKTKEVMDMFARKGYKPNLLDAKVGRVITKNRIAEVVVIPMRSKHGVARLIYVSVNGKIKVSAVEAIERTGSRQIVIYRIVNGKISKYTIQITGDNSCTSTCGLICGMSSATMCLILCSVAAENPLCDIGCSVAMGGVCGAACDYWCTGHINPCDVGCGAFCSGICSGVCNGITSKLGIPELSYFCEKYACSPACTAACGEVCGS